MTRQIDMRRTGWGHSWYVKQRADGTMHGLTHCTPGPKVGDEVVWRTSYGEAVGKITQCKWLMDPSDQYEVTLDVIARHTAGSGTLWDVNQ